MFKLHDKTRRFLTLSIFLLLGPALLFVVVAKGCSRHSIRTVAGWEALLTDSLGKRVEIESVRFPAPGVVRFSQMRIFDPETNGVFLQIPQWELIERFGEMPHSIDPTLLSQVDGEDVVASSQTETPTKYLDDIRTRTPCKRGLFASFGFAWSNFFGRQPRYLHCEIPKVSCYDTAIPQVKDTLLAQAAKQPGTKTNRSQTGVDLKPMVLFVGTIDVFCTDGKPGNPTLPGYEVTNISSRQLQTPKPDCVTITDACFEFRPTEEQSTFLAIFQQADQPSDAKPFQLAVSRWRHPVALTRVQFTSGDNEVPNRILTGLDPFFAAFGQQSRFNGNIVAEKSVNPQKNRTRSLELNQAAFFNVTLDSLLGRSLTFRLDGEVDKVMLDSVRFYGETNDTDTLRLEHAKGRIYSAKGLVSWPGLRRLVQGTKLQIFPENASPPDTDIYFRNGTFAFQIDAQGIQLYPASDPSQQRLPLFVIDNHCNVFSPNTGGYVIRYVDFFASLAQPNAQQIPLMPETRHLITTLPITIEQEVPAINTQPPQVQPQARLIEIVSETAESLSSSILPNNTPQRQVAELQPQPTNREIAPTMMPVPAMPIPSAPVPSTPVPSLAHAMPLEQYQHQYQPQFATGNDPNGPRQPDSSVVVPWSPREEWSSREDSYTSAQRPNESLFGLQQNSYQATPSPPPAIQPVQQQPTQPLLTQLQTPPSIVPYGENSQQLMAVHQPSNRVVIPTLSGNSSRVQTDRTLVAPSPYNNEMPATFDPYQQMQVASAPQLQHFNNMPTTVPSSTMSPVPSSPSPFGLLETNPQYNR